MKFPPLLIGAALLFWGFETDRLLISILLAVVIEASYIIQIRYDLDEDDFVKISDLTSLIFLGSVVLILLNYESSGFLRITVSWVPLLFFPLMIAQLYSTGDTITIGTKLGKREKSFTHKPIDFRIYYIFQCVFAAATGNSRSIWFYLLLGIVFAFLFFKNRGRFYSLSSFIVLFCFVFGFGYMLSVGMEKSYQSIMQSSFHFLQRYYRDQHADPYKTLINFGDTGRLKYSGKIIMRVESSKEPPALFKEASYATYQNGDWLINRGKFEYLTPVDEENWNLRKPPQHSGNSLTVERNLPQEKGMLPYPIGSYRVTSKTIYELAQHRNGSMKIIDGAPVVTYDLAYNPDLVKQMDTPRERNLEVPQSEKYVLEQIGNRLELNNQPARIKVAAIQKYFNSGYSYSLNLLGSGDFETPLGNFLLGRKSGFCEYYATATALLLRHLNIPSRYVVGYAVHEKSKLEGKYIVRSRHAHAWAEAYVDGAWIIVDTTPSDWFEKDAEIASIFESVLDVFYFVRHKYQLFQITGDQDYTLLFSVIVVVLTVFLVIRIYRRMKLEQVDTKSVETLPRSFERIITPLTPLIDDLNASDIKRVKNEPFTNWALRSGLWLDFDKEEFSHLYNLHLKLRFDPDSASKEERITLEKGVERFIREYDNQEAEV